MASRRGGARRESAATCRDVGRRQAGRREARRDRVAERGLGGRSGRRCGVGRRTTAVLAHQRVVARQLLDDGAEHLRREVGGRGGSCERSDSISMPRWRGSARWNAASAVRTAVAQLLPLLGRGVGLGMRGIGQRTQVGFCFGQQRAHRGRRAGWRRRRAYPGRRRRRSRSPAGRAAARAASVASRSAARCARPTASTRGVAGSRANGCSTTPPPMVARARRLAQDEAVAAEGRDRLAQHELREAPAARRQRVAPVEPDDAARGPRRCRGSSRTAAWRAAAGAPPGAARPRRRSGR